MKENSLQEKPSLYHPKFWGYWLLLGLFWVLVQLPWSWRRAIGASIGRVAFHLVKRRQFVVKTNLKIAFPDLSDAARKKLELRCAESVGQGFLEIGMGWFWSDKRLKKISYMTGDAKAIALIKNPEVPLVLVGSHSTLLELGVRLLGIYTNSAGMYRPLKNLFFERWIKYQRSRAATHLINFKDMRQVLKVLKSGGNIWYALDQDMNRRASVFAPFFGVQTNTVNILPKLRERTGARWVPVFVWREDKTRKYVVKVLPEMVPREGQTDVETATQLNAIYEAEIRLHPEQYFWVHRRFKNRPEGEADLYGGKR